MCHFLLPHERHFQADLDLLIPPEIQSLENLKGPLGEESQWVAVIKSNPKSDVVWEKNGKDLTEDERFTLDDDDHKNGKYKLKISKVKQSDAGTYKITATNEYGTASAEAEMSIYSE